MSPCCVFKPDEPCLRNGLVRILRGMKKQPGVVKAVYTTSLGMPMMGSNLIHERPYFPGCSISGRNPLLARGTRLPACLAAMHMQECLKHTMSPSRAAAEHASNLRHCCGQCLPGPSSSFVFACRVMPCPKQGSTDARGDGPCINVLYIDAWCAPSSHDRQSWEPFALSTSVCSPQMWMDLSSEADANIWWSTGFQETAFTVPEWPSSDARSSPVARCHTYTCKPEIDRLVI